MTGPPEIQIYSILDLTGIKPKNFTMSTIHVHHDHDDHATTSSRGISHNIGGETYIIDPSRINSTPTSFLRTAIKSVVLLVLSPVLVLLSIVFFVCMYTGPLWLRNKILSIMIPRIMKCQAEKFGPERDKLLQRVENSVLDVGCGGGAYLRHYTKANNIVALEPVVEMHADIRRVAKEVGISDENLEILPLTIQEYVDMQSSNETSNTTQFDWIIMGNVLCEVPNVITTFESVKLLTKPGGHVYFSEHEGAKSGTWARLIQDIMNPMWTIVSGGCNCNRDTLQMVYSCLGEKDWEFVVWEYPNVRVAMGPSFLGLARKK